MKTRKVSEDTKHSAEKRRLKNEYTSREADEEIRKYKDNREKEFPINE